MASPPTPNVPNGRTPNGRFAKGNPGGPGNPHARRIAQFRSAVLGAVTPEDLDEVVRGLLDAAKSGDLAATKLLLDRTLGKATAQKDDTETAPLALPALATTKDTVDAMSTILTAMGDGRITAETATKMSSVVELARRTLETHELAARVDALEAESREAG